MIARWKGSSVRTPSISNSSSARAMRRVAASRSASQTISLATIGSYSGVISEPAAHARVHPHARAGRLPVAGDRARGGGEVARGVLGVDAALDRVPAQRDLVLARRTAARRPRRGSARARCRCRSTASVTQCSTCTRVFISRKKYSPSGEQALDRARAAVADRARRLGGDAPDALAQRVVDQRRRRLLDQLLVAALDRAVALAEVDHGAVRVGQHLHLDVARVGQVALQVHRRVGEELLALARGARERVGQRAGVERDAEALAAAAARRLDGDRVADLLRGLPRRLERLHGRGGARHDRHAGGLHQLARAGLRAHRLDRRGGRADEADRPPPPAAARRPRSRRGSRSPGGPPRRPSARPPRAAGRRRGRTRRPAPGRAGAPRRRAATCSASRSASE